MFNKISEKNYNQITLPNKSSLVNYSTFKELETDFLFRSFSIKYVIDGCEKYAVEGKNHKISSGEFLLANNTSGGKLLIDSNTIVKGLCIDISPQIMNDVAVSLMHPDFDEIVNLEESFFSSSLYPQNKYSIENNDIGKNLKKIANTIDSNPNYNFEFTNEFYFELATSIVENQKAFSSQIKRINATKITTKKELFTKLLQGKYFIDTNFLNISSIQEIALACQMSEFQFFRLFKLLFETSPYQYLNQKKLEYASQLIKKQTHSLTDIALIVGYTDLPTFSKRFKRNYGFSPYALKRN